MAICKAGWPIQGFLRPWPNHCRESNNSSHLVLLTCARMVLSTTEGLEMFYKNYTVVTTFAGTLSILLSVYIWPGTEPSREPWVVRDISPPSERQRQQLSCLEFPRSGLQTPGVPVWDQHRSSHVLTRLYLFSIQPAGIFYHFSCGESGIIQKCVLRLQSGVSLGGWNFHTLMLCQSPGNTNDCLHSHHYS